MSLLAPFPWDEHQVPGEMPWWAQGTREGHEAQASQTDGHGDAERHRRWGGLSGTALPPEVLGEGV